MKILNLGCGSGQNIPQLLKTNKQEDLTCVDMSESSIAKAKSKFPQVNFVVSKGEDINFQENLFDEIYCFDVLEHVQDLDKVMQNILKSLKKGGKLYVEVPYDKSETMLLKVNPEYHKNIGHVRIFEYKKIRETFENLGLEVKSIKTSRGIVNIYLWLVFKFGMDSNDQMGTVVGPKRLLERFLFAIEIWFDKNIFNTFLKWIPIWIFTLPIGWVISRVFPKTVEINLIKK
jgi:SAM-dependent methyltransferase